MDGFNKNIEGPRESFPTKEDVVSLVESIPEIKNPKIIKELIDDKGVYLLEFSAKGNEEGESLLVQYVRKRSSRVESKDDRVGSISTKIDIIYYKDGQIYDGVEYAEYNEKTGKWRF